MAIAEPGFGAKGLILISAKPAIFIAGADLRSIQQMSRDELTQFHRARAADFQPDRRAQVSDRRRDSWGGSRRRFRDQLSPAIGASPRRITRPRSACRKRSWESFPRGAAAPACRASRLARGARYDSRRQNAAGETGLEKGNDRCGRAARTFAEGRARWLEKGKTAAAMVSFANHAQGPFKARRAEGAQHGPARKRVATIRRWSKRSTSFSRPRRRGTKPWLKAPSGTRSWISPALPTRIGSRISFSCRNARRRSRFRMYPPAAASIRRP